MKNILLILVLSISILGKAQQAMLVAAVENYKTIAGLVKYDSINKLANLIVYPLRRENPIPDIKSAKEFISYYPILFDNKFKQELIDVDSSQVFQHNGTYAISHGDIWIDEVDTCRILAINYMSDKEKELSEKLTEEIKNKMYLDIGPWERNIIVCESDKYIVRIDDINGRDSLRYISWGKGKSISDKPDLVLYGGTYEFQGTQGGITYSFTNGKWTYVIDEVEMCENDTDCGIFLEILNDGKIAGKYRCTETK